MGDLLKFRGMHRVDVFYQRYAREFAEGSSAAMRDMPIDNANLCVCVVSAGHVAAAYGRSVTWVKRNFEDKCGWVPRKAKGWGKATAYLVEEIYADRRDRFLFDVALFAWSENLCEDDLDRLAADCWVRGYEWTQALFSMRCGVFLEGMKRMPSWLCRFIVDGRRDCALELAG